MAKLILLLSITFCLTEICFSRKCDSMNDRSEYSDRYIITNPKEYEAKQLGISIQQLLEIQSIDLSLHYDSQNDAKKACKLCEIINSNRIGLTVNATKEMTQRFYVKLNEISRLPKSEAISFLDTTCNFLYDPETEIKKAKIFGLVLDQYQRFEFTRLNKINTRTAAESIATARTMCNIFHSTQIVASIKAKQHPTLTAEQFIAFRTIANEVGHADDSAKAATFEKLCEFLNETVSPIEQAQELGISIELYHKIVEVKKRNTDTESTDSFLNTIRGICREINAAEGVFNKTQSTIVLSPEQMQSYDEEITIALTHENNKKRIPLIRAVCVNLTESIPTEKVAELFGLSLNEFEQMESIIQNNTDLSIVGRVGVTRELCDVINPSIGITVCEDIDLNESQLEEFVKQENRFKAAPITERLSLLKKLCSLVNGNSSEQSNWI